MKTYSVKKIDGPISLTGRGEDSNWDKATLLDDFTYPWRNEKEPKTEFKALHDGDNLYFLYKATDDQIISKVEENTEKEVAQCDRVEIFFKINDDMNPYYSLEMDAQARVLDTKGKFYRDVDFNWNWPMDHLTLHSSTHEWGYIVEGKISFSSLEEFGLINGSELNAGLYRGEYYYNKDKIEVKWISWVKPDSEKPDFHIPSSFGKLILADY